MVLYYILAVAKTSVTLPYADFILPAFPFALVILMYGILIGILWWLKKNPPAPLGAGGLVKQA
ncbi:hypothetical protein H0X32_01160 [Patescibacteria group bacterium]|nr:hypothetical protein [Patescibacteria group bacterium]